MTTQIYPPLSLSTVLPAGAATAANQALQITEEQAVNTKLTTIHNDLNTTIHTDLNTTIHGDLNTISGKIPALGQAAMVASIPVVIANNQTALPIRALVNTDVVKAQLQDNAGAAVVLGQTAMATSLPVTIANNQSSLPVSITSLTVVDQIDTTPLLDTSSSNIPANSANSLSLVASTAAAVKKVVSVEDIGEFFGLYSGPVATPTLLCVLPLGGGEMDVSIPAGTLVSIRHMKNSAITSGYIAINFLG